VPLCLLAPGSKRFKTSSLNAFTPDGTTPTCVLRDSPTEVSPPVGVS